jgi:hypothetical protein
MKSNLFGTTSGRMLSVVLALLGAIGTATLGGCGAPNANGDYLVWSSTRRDMNYNHWTHKSYRVNAHASVNGKFGSTRVNRTHTSFGGWNNNCDY